MKKSAFPIGLSLCLGALIILGAYPSNHIYTADGLEQIATARCLAQGMGLDCPGLSYWPPGFSLAMLVVGPLCGSWEAAARLVSVISASLLPGVVYAITTLLARHARLPESHLLGGLAGALAFAAPHLFFYAEMADNRTLYLLLSALVFWALARLLLKGEISAALGAAILASLASLTRPEGKALVAIALVSAVIAAYWHRKNGIRKSLAVALLPPIGVLVVFLPYLWMVHEVLGIYSLNTRDWEMHIVHWAVILPKDVILSLFGFTVHGTPLRDTLIEALRSGSLPNPGLPFQASNLMEVYLQQLPVVAQLAFGAIPRWLWLMTPLGFVVMVGRRQWLSLLLIVFFLSPYLLYPALPQSIDDKVPTGNFLTALIPFAALSSLFIGRLLEPVPQTLRRWLLPGIIPVLGLSLGLWAGRAVEKVDEELHLFEGHPLPRGAAAYLKANISPEARLVTTYPGTVVAHFAGMERTPMPSVWELSHAFDAWQDKETIVVLVNPDLTDKGLMVSELISMVPKRCEPILHLRGEGLEWIFACRVKGT